MVHLTVFLLVLAVVALLAEMFVPGTEVFGVVGFIALVVSAVLAVVFVPGGWFIVAGQVVLLACFARFFVRLIQRKQLQGKVILNETLSEDVPAHDMSGFVGKEGITATALRPYGEADFEGARMEVSSGGPMIEKGTKVRAVAIRESKLIVRPSEGN
ncbi:MAG: NfeD family protein [Defluviitaleaceae bacterium]|nr:NfeD family protein [Defluviitaleaceae bacterium]